MARLAQGETVDPSEYYFRVAPVFETGAERYAWLNKILAVGVGERPPPNVVGAGTKARCAITALGSYPSTPLAERPRPSHHG